MKKMIFLIFLIININIYTQEILVQGAYDTDIKIDPDKITKVVSLAPNITEIIYAIGMESKLIGRTNYCNYPKEVQNVNSVGEIMTPSIERILQMKPDLIIASNHTVYTTYQRINEQGIKIIMLDDIKKISDIYILVEKIGLMLNANEEAIKLNQNLMDKIECDVNRNSDKIKIYYMLSYGKSGDYTAGGDTFIGDLINISGGINIAQDISGWKYSIEQLLINDPDIIIFSSKYIKIEDLNQSPIYKELRAVKQNNVYYIDEDKIVRAGPRIWEGISELREIIDNYSKKKNR